MNKVEKKVQGIDNKVLNWIEKHIFQISFLIITILAIVIRILFIDVEFGDYDLFLKPWFDGLKEHGGLPGLKYYDGNYNYPYITIMALLTYLPIKSLVSIKLVSIIFDFILAITCSKIIEIIFKNGKNSKLYSLIIYAVVLFLPTVILNSSYWGQCDSIYTAFAMLAILSLLKEKYLKAFIFLGISFAFKLQFILILPVFIYVYASKRKFPIYYFLIIPLINFILCLPAIISGKSIMECVFLYIQQAGTYNNYISMIFPGIYNIFMPVDSNDYVLNNIEGLGPAFIIITLVILFIALITIIHKKIDIKNEMLIQLSLWSVMVCAFLLPNMHERYLFMGDILSVLYFVVSKNWKKIYISLGVNLISFYGYSRLLLGVQILNIEIMSILNLILIMIITKDVFKNILNAKQERNEI